MTSPTQRSLAYLRQRYPLCEVVEHWNPYARVRKDLFGIIDIVVVGPQMIMGVQTTSASNVAKRIRKIEASSATPILRRAGIKLLVHGWGKRKGRWQLREVDVS